MLQFEFACRLWFLSEAKQDNFNSCQLGEAYANAKLGVVPRVWMEFSTWGFWGISPGGFLGKLNWEFSAWRFWGWLVIFVWIWLRVLFGTKMVDLPDYLYYSLPPAPVRIFLALIEIYHQSHASCTKRQMYCPSALVSARDYGYLRA